MVISNPKYFATGVLLILSPRTVKEEYTIKLRLRPFFLSSLDLGDKIPSTFGEDLFFGFQSISGTASELEA